MAKVYGQQFIDRYELANYSNFLSRRIARIYPLYIILFSVALALSIPRTGSYSIKYFALIAGNVFLVQTWFGKYSFLGTAWSLSTEWAAYLVFPVLVASVLKSRRSFAFVTCAAAGAAIAFVVISQISAGVPARTSLDTGDGGIASMLRCFGGFIIGMAVFRISSLRKSEFMGNDLLGFSLLFLIFTLWFIRSTPDVVIYITFPFLVLCLSLNKGRFSHLFSNKLAFTLGEWSYSMYLIHILLQRERGFVFDNLSRDFKPIYADILGSIIFFSTTICLSMVAYSWIEVPARNKIRDWMGARRTPVGMEPSAP